MTLLAETLKLLTDDHKLDPITDTVRVKSQDCKLKSGEESLFVANFAHELYLRLNEGGVKHDFHKLFYCPSRRTEWKLGFDLSIGKGEATQRIRTMHKLITGRLCDGKWTWLCRDDDALHMALLMGAQQALCAELHPYLVIYVCRCVHDYRRMGFVADNGCIIPPFHSPVRTIIVDLRLVRNSIAHLTKINWGSLFEIVRNAADKEEAVDSLAEFDVGRIKLVNENPFTDLKNAKITDKEILDKHCPTLYYPSVLHAKDSRSFFLSFTEFVARVVAVGKQFWM